MKASLKPLLYLAITILVFALFIYLLLRPSEQSKAIAEIATCLNSDDVKNIWGKYRRDLADDQDYHQAVRDKLKTFNLKQPEITEIKKWLPPKTQNLNIILVPDLSRRIKDDKNNPNQIENDTALLNTIWAMFEQTVRLKMNSRDKLVVDVSDRGQGQGQFNTIANNLVFDLSDFKGKSNRLYFNSIKGQFATNIAQLYNLAIQNKTTGANYVTFFSDKLPLRIQKSTIEDEYRNIVILITDGYLETTTQTGSTNNISPPCHILKKYCASQNKGPLPYPIPITHQSFPDTEVYLFEVNEREIGKDCDLIGLKRWWTDWFKVMNIKNSNDDFVFIKQDAFFHTKKEAQGILQQ